MLTISNILKKHGYTLDKLIGKGNTSECYLIDNPQFGQKQFVCKIIDLVKKDGNQHSIEAATKEIQILSQMDHPNIIRCYDYFQEENTLFAVLEYCKNGNMADLILSRNSIEYSKLHDFSIQLVDAVSFLHLNNIAHLDITPANIFLVIFLIVSAETTTGAARERARPPARCVVSENKVEGVQCTRQRKQS